MTFDELKLSADPIISNAAHNIDRYKQELEQNKITQAEFETLINTALRMDQVASLAQDTARYAAIQEAFSILLSLATA